MSDNDTYHGRVAKIRQHLARIQDEGDTATPCQHEYVRDVGLLLNALDSLTATAKALPAERVTAEQNFYDENNDHFGSTTMTEVNPDRERLYWYGESGIADQKTVKVVVDIDAWLAVLDYMTDWTPND